MSLGSRVVVVYDSYAGTNGDALAGRVSTIGGKQLEIGIGCWALGASIQSNKAKRTSNGSGGETLHNYTAILNDRPGAQPLEFIYALTRPNDSTNHRFGFFLRGDGGQFNGATADQIIVYIERVDDNNVSIKVRCTENTVQRQAVTVTASFAWAKNVAKYLGCTLDGNQLQVFTEPTLDGTRTLQGSAVTLSTTLNDASHKRAGPWVQLGVTSGFLWDDFRVSYINTLPTAPGAFVTPQADDVVGHTTYGIEVGAATDADAVDSLQYEFDYSINGGAGWGVVRALGARTYTWDVSGLPQDTDIILRARAHDGTDYGPYVQSGAFLAGSSPDAPAFVKVTR